MSGLFGGGAPAPAPAPIVSPPPVMPTPDDAAVKAAKAKSRAGILARSGRLSTINTAGELSDTLG